MAEINPGAAAEYTLQSIPRAGLMLVRGNVRTPLGTPPRRIYFEEDGYAVENGRLVPKFTIAGGAAGSAAAIEAAYRQGWNEAITAVHVPLRK